jgi:hypothetical protein
MELTSEAFSVKLSDSALDELSRCKSREERGRKLLEFIDAEIAKMDQWASSHLGGPGAKFENAYLRTYLYRKITGELNGEGDIEHLPQINMEAHPALSG